jgi:hypothetical protein
MTRVAASSTLLSALFVSFSAALRSPLSTWNIATLSLNELNILEGMKEIVNSLTLQAPKRQSDTELCMFAMYQTPQLMENSDFFNFY